VKDIAVPDIGDFSDVPIIEIHVAPGDTVAPEDPLVTLESEKATLDVPAPEAGTVGELRVSVGDTVSEGTVLITLEPAGATAGAEADAAQDAELLPEEGAETPENLDPSYGSEAGVYEVVDVRVPELGDLDEVPVVEVHVAAGDEVHEEDTLVTLRSGEREPIAIPAPAGGTVQDLDVAVGDTVSEGTLILRLDGTDGAGPARPAAAAPPPSADPGAEPDVRADVVVLGSGPGGYTAAFRAADLGLKTVIVERYPSLGGVCLNVGCIPSKALLHIAKVISETEETASQGVSFGAPQIEVEALREWKDGVVGRLTGGLSGLARTRKVQVVQGRAGFASDHLLAVEGEDGQTTTIGFENAIIACGSQATRLPGFPYDDPRLMDSTHALQLQDIPERMLVIGGGIIGLEMATVYDALGTRITVVELMDSLIPGCDTDLVRPLHKRIQGRYEAIHLKTRVTGVEPLEEGLRVTFEGDDAPEPQLYDRVLLAVGRRPNGALIGAERAGVAVDERGFIHVDDQQRTNVSHIFAIGDVVGEPMLAHKATHEGRVAAEVAAGHDVAFDGRVIPSVAYTEPEVAWVGLTETQAKAQGRAYDKGAFPWAASGRSLSQGRDEGTTKLLVDPETRRVLGAGIVGPNAGELIAEATHAVEMGADAEDVGLTIHPHPTLSETIGFAAEMAEGTITDLLAPASKRRGRERAGSAR